MCFGPTATPPVGNPPPQAGNGGFPPPVFNDPNVAHTMPGGWGNHGDFDGGQSRFLGPPVQAPPPDIDGGQRPPHVPRPPDIDGDPRVRPRPTPLGATFSQFGQ